MDSDPTPVGTASRWAVLTSTFQRSGLRAVVLIFGCFKVAELGAWIAITTAAYVQGGVNLATVVLVAQLTPATLAALWVDRVIDSVGAVPILIGGLVVQATGLAAVGAVLWADGPFPVVVLGSAVAATAVVTTRPSLQTLLPHVVVEPQELTAANSVMGWILGAATLVGPAVTAATYSSVGRWTPFALFAALDLGAAAVAVRLRAAQPAPSDSVSNPGRSDTGDEKDGSGTDLRAVRLTLFVIGAGGFLWGAIDLLEAVVAIDLTGGPPARAAALAAAFGAGALVGGLSTVLLIGRRQLWPVMAVAALVTSLVMVGVGSASSPVVAAVMLAVVGATSTAMVVAARTLLQRISDFDTVCRAFALAEATEMGTLLAGSLVVPALVATVGARWAPAVVGAVVAASALAAVRSVAPVEAGLADQLDRLQVLRSTALLSLLPAPALELLARHAQRRTLSAGTTVIAEGDVGDSFYVVESGTMTVSREGDTLRTMGPGSGFGEIALLLDRPRTATVVAQEQVTVLEVGRMVFLTAVTGHAASRQQIREMADRHARDDYEHPEG